MKQTLRCLCLLLASALAASCEEKQLDAEIVIVVDTDFAVPEALNEVTFWVNRVGADESLAQLLPVSLTGRLGKPFPLRLGIAPESDVKTAVEVRVEGFHITNPGGERPEPIVRRKARVRFQRGKVLLLRMDLVARCSDPVFLQCEADASKGTCDEGGCSDVDNPQLFPWTGSDQDHAPALEGGPGDGPDAGGDGDGDGDGDLDGGPGDDAGTPDDDAGPDRDPHRPVELALAEHHSCLRTASGQVHCWGSNQNGQLGDGLESHGSTCTIEDGPEVDCTFEPVKVVELPRASQLSAGVYTSCAVHEPLPTTDANVSCWGEVPQGLVSNTPEGVLFGSLLLDDALEVRVGGRHSCVRRAGALPVCWGEYVSGELGNGNATDYPEDGIALASELEGKVSPDDIKAIIVGDRHSCAHLVSGRLWCWGRNDLGQAGQPLTEEVVLTPVEHIGLGVAETVISGAAHMCALVENEGAYCFGEATFGQLGVGPFDADDIPKCGDYANCTPTPVKVIEEDLPAAIEQLAAGADFTCARLGNGDVYCWGRNQLGQLGPKPVTTVSLVPVKVAGLNGKAVQLAAGSGHVCAILEDHSVMCWGRNDTGQLGAAPGGAVFSAMPVTVSY
jgi:alpha-tubulin suppressor-like RCC1 family protein